MTQGIVIGISKAFQLGSMGVIAELLYDQSDDNVNTAGDQIEFKTTSFQLGILF